MVAVAAEAAGRRELAELVPDHGLGDEHGHVLAPVVDRQGVADELGEDRRAPRPGLDDRFSRVSLSFSTLSSSRGSQ